MAQCRTSDTLPPIVSDLRQRVFIEPTSIALSMANRKGVQKTEAGVKNEIANAKSVSIKGKIAESMLADLLAKAVKSERTYGGFANLYLDESGCKTPVYGKYVEGARVIGAASHLTQIVGAINPDGTGFISVYREGKLLNSFDMDAEPVSKPAEKGKDSQKGAATKSVKSIAVFVGELKAAGIPEASIVTMLGDAIKAGTVA